MKKGILISMFVACLLLAGMLLIMTDCDRIAEQLRQLSDTLIINASFLNDIGLLNGKTGIALFFFHLAQATLREDVHFGNFPGVGFNPY
jgi:hypothetical protein